jgi:ABC-type molybdate transport system substrate-binding protein
MVARGLVAVFASALLLAGVRPLGAEEALRLYAAGSLRRALTEVAAGFTRASGIAVEGTFGASGLLRERLERGERADVFASADVGNPRRLAEQGKAGTVVVFARNQLCALVRPGLDVTSATLLDRMLAPAVKLGTSTPGADPSGDYAWEVFRKADAIRQGAGAALEAKALKLTGGRGAPPPSASGRGIYTELIARGAADIFLTYCTNASVVVQELPEAHIVALPPALAVGADYGVTALAGPRTGHAEQLIAFMLSPAAQAVLQRHGFSPPVSGKEK